jgi:uncharacterized repeat protein (TIGR03837 family)
LWTIPTVNSQRTWDIFCKVIDNYGDIGVCWRLSADLAGRGQQVRLWIDDPRALAWMAPQALQGAVDGVRVLPWSGSREADVLADLQPSDVWVEGFGCELEEAFVAHRFAPVQALGRTRTSTAPAWINLEYLSAEDFSVRAHGLPSPILHGPAQGHTRWFYYPGLDTSSGGLIREPGLENRQREFDRPHWLSSLGLDWRGERVVSLFCYEPQALGELLAQFQTGPAPTMLLVTQGRAAQAVADHLVLDTSFAGGPGTNRRGALTVVFLPALTQVDFDHLLWACDVNFVRGEDSLVRALWSGRPFVWQIYPQHDLAHQAKLRALLHNLDAPPSWRRFHLAWNGIGETSLPALEPAAWGDAVQRARNRLTSQTDLGTRLIEFADKLRQGV